MTPEILSKVVENHQGPSPNGIDCHFINLDDQWGIKVYEYKDRRDMSVENQTLMSKHGYAPKVGPVFDIGEKFCYVTEKATPLIEQEKGESERHYWNRFFTTPLPKGFQTEEDFDESRELINKMREEGFIMHDNHAGNFGRLNGKIVCIDLCE